jgi:3-oxoacyl-[acyl-carrier-protein] synthase-3
MRQAVVSGTGFYAPERIVTNAFFSELYKRDMDTFLREQRNIVERRFMAPDQATSDLILPAARMALDRAGLRPQDLDLIVVATDTPDYLSPATAAVVQYRLGARQAGCFDLNSACAGFVTALDLAAKYLRADEAYRHILVVGAYGMSKYLNFDDYKIASLFADGAGACVVSAGNEAGVLGSALFADGQYHDYMGIYAGGTRTPIAHDVLEKRAHLLNFAKKIPIETNGREWPRLTRLVLDRIRRQPSDVKKFFMTQINIHSINEALDALRVERTLSHNIMDRYGYTGSACIPMALHDAVERRSLKKGDLVFLLGSGGGLSMAALALEWAYDT